MLHVDASAWVNVSAKEEALVIQAPFGELSIPYSRITSVEKEEPQGISVNVNGAKIWLQIGYFPDEVTLRVLLQEKSEPQR